MKYFPFIFIVDFFTGSPPPPSLSSFIAALSESRYERLPPTRQFDFCFFDPILSLAHLPGWSYIRPTLLQVIASSTL